MVRITNKSSTTNIASKFTYHDTVRTKPLLWWYACNMINPVLSKALNVNSFTLLKWIFFKNLNNVMVMFQAASHNLYNNGNSFLKGNVLSFLKLPIYVLWFSFQKVVYIPVVFPAETVWCIYHLMCQHRRTVCHEHSAARWQPLWRFQHTVDDPQHADGISSRIPMNGRCERYKQYNVNGHTCIWCVAMCVINEEPIFKTQFFFIINGQKQTLDSKFIICHGYDAWKQNLLTFILTESIN